MPNTDTLMQNLRRMSSPKMFRRSSKEDDLRRNGEHDQGGGRRRRREGTMFTLPVELLANILQDVSFKDLCAVRSTCSTANQLLSEGDIIWRWIHNDNLHPHEIELYPPPNPPTFIYVIEQERRSRIVESTAEQYATYIESEIVRHTLQRRDASLTGYHFHKAFKPIWENIGVALLPLLMTLQHYLEQFGDAILESCETDSPDHTRTFRHQFTARRHAILAQYEPERLHLVYKFWLFLAWVNNALLNRPSYAGYFEQAIRGWAGDPLRQYETNIVLTFGHFTVRRQLMSLKSHKERRKLVDKHITELTPETNGSWREHWTKLSLRYGKCPTKQAAEAALKVKFQAGEVFADSARAILVEHGLEEADSNLDIGTAEQCCKFLIEIAGYDVLHVPPSRAPPEIRLRSYDRTAGR